MGVEFKISILLEMLKLAVAAEWKADADRIKEALYGELGMSIPKTGSVGC